ncbi:hypothetical protein POTOM_019522 [Populus tomentosa]|uniref:GAG-pre-integrase domain-containing protein n=1 Tax=Populus tomentosa TaxID=118781 RepID=A0A8X8D2N9_POPTO|nr:hypothetical protein POTOM_019522 [Populus tomentosa]
MDGNSFYLKLDAVEGHVFYAKVDESIMWHKRYDHFNLKSLKFMHDAVLVMRPSCQKGLVHVDASLGHAINPE